MERFRNSCSLAIDPAAAAIRGVHDEPDDKPENRSAAPHRPRRCRGFRTMNDEESMSDTQHPISSGDERHERDFNRHRLSEERDVRAEVAGRLRARGIAVEESDSAEQVVDLL